MHTRTRLHTRSLLPAPHARLCLCSAHRYCPAGDAEVLRWLAPGRLLADGLSSYGRGAFEAVYVNGTFALSKGGLTQGSGTMLLLVPEFGVSVSVFIALNSGSLPDTVASQFIRCPCHAPSRSFVPDAVGREPSPRVFSR